VQKSPWKPKGALKPLDPNKRYVMCSNCGLAIEERYIMNHYKFCAMTTPPSDQPYRGD
jgi:hypothetical protein